MRALLPVQQRERSTSFSCVWLQPRGLHSFECCATCRACMRHHNLLSPLLSVSFDVWSCWCARRWMTAPPWLTASIVRRLDGHALGLCCPPSASHCEVSWCAPVVCVSLLIEFVCRGSSDRTSVWNTTSFSSSRVPGARPWSCCRWSWSPWVESGPAACCCLCVACVCGIPDVRLCPKMSADGATLVVECSVSWYTRKKLCSASAFGVLLILTSLFMQFSTAPFARGDARSPSLLQTHWMSPSRKVGRCRWWAEVECRVLRIARAGAVWHSLRLLSAARARRTSGNTGPLWPAIICRLPLERRSRSQWPATGRVSSGF